MYILQLARLRPLTAEVPNDPNATNTKSSMTEGETVLAVARSDSLKVLEDFFSSMLNTNGGGVVEFYDSTLEDGVTPALKAFKPGSPLEFYVPPLNSEMLFVDLGTLESRIEELKAEVEKQARETWGKMLTHVLDIQPGTDTSTITPGDLETPDNSKAKELSTAEALAEQTSVFVEGAATLSLSSGAQDSDNAPTLSIGVDTNVKH